MEIPRRRQDADVARVAVFLRRHIRMIAAVAVERFDQRRSCRHRVLAGERVVGETNQIVGAVEHPLRDQMRDMLGTALDVTLDQDQA